MDSIEDSVKETKTAEGVRWSPWVGVVFVIAVFFFSEKFVAPFILSVYPLFIKHWSLVQANNWLDNSIPAQFFYVLIAEAFCVGAILIFLKLYHVSPKVIGLRRPRWSDPLYGLLAVPVYYVLYLLTVGVVSGFDHGLNVSQKQEIGFTGVHGGAQLILTFLSLVILPPLAEEIMARGLLYSSLKKGMPQVAALLVTSAIFASAHLPEGGTAGLLWIAALDTFVLSVVLVYLREKTGGLWASMTLHALKNGVAYYALYLVPLLHFH